jgi:hypothetical protein
MALTQPAMNDDRPTAEMLEAGLPVFRAWHGVLDRESVLVAIPGDWKDAVKDALAKASARQRSRQRRSGARSERRFQPRHP